MGSDENCLITGGFNIAKRLTLGLRFYQVRAWSVHLYTSIGLLIGLLALQAVFAGEAQMVFMWIGLSTLIDATDGTLARHFKVTHWVPQFDGRTLDNVVDYLNYTFIPVVFAYRFELVPPAAVPVLGLVLMAAAYGFCLTDAKTSDGYFTGFPNFWNVMFFYLYLLKLQPTTNVIILLIFVGLVFVPIRYISGSTRPLRPLTIGVMSAFWVALITMGITMNNVDMRLVIGSLAAAVYYFAASFYLHFKHSRCSVDEFILPEESAV